MKIYFMALMVLIFIFSCDGGLQPPEPDQKTFITGSIIIKDAESSWPPQDSAYFLRVVCFKELPKDSSSIINEILSGNVIFTNDSLPLFTEQIKYKLEITEPPVLLKYISVVLQYQPDFMAQKVISVYSISDNPEKPDSLFISRGEEKEIDFFVDFKNLPPQPF